MGKVMEIESVKNKGIENVSNKHLNDENITTLAIMWLQDIISDLELRREN